MKLDSLLESCAYDLEPLHSVETNCSIVTTPTTDIIICTPHWGCICAYQKFELDTVDRKTTETDAKHANRI